MSGSFTSKRIIGIDFGASKTVMAVWQYGEVGIITAPQGGRMVPSMVSYLDSGQVMVGWEALKQALDNDARTDYGIKNRLGFKDFRNIREPVYSAKELCTRFACQLKSNAEVYLGQAVDKIVLTVPNKFNVVQRQAIREAFQKAGLEIVRMLNDSAAAALAYGLNMEEEKNILVFDLGAASESVAILNIGDGVFQVIAANGNNQLGGNNFDGRLVEWLLTRINQEHGYDLRSDPKAVQLLKNAAQDAKHELSNTFDTAICIPVIGGRDNLALEYDLSRTEFDELTKDLVGRAMVPIEQAMKDAGCKPADIDDVVLLGGCSRIPAVQEAIRNYFGDKSVSCLNAEALAVGAAIQAAILDGEIRDTIVMDATSLALGVESPDGFFITIIPRNTTIPISKSLVISTTYDNQTSIDIPVLQGEYKTVEQNTSLGGITLKGIKPVAKGIPQIEVVFDVDVNGFLKVRAQDRETNRQESLIISS